TAARAAELGAREIQLLRYKPAGRADDATYLDRRLQPSDVRALWPAIERLVAAKHLRVRIDCAMGPLLSAALLEPVPDAARALASLGVFGCEAARHLGALTADGDVAACSFFSLDGLIAIGKGSDERAPRSADLASTWDTAPALMRLRAYHAAPPE